MVAIKITGLTFLWLWALESGSSTRCIVASLTKAFQCMTDKQAQSYWCSCQYIQKTESGLSKELQKLKCSPAGGNTASWKEEWLHSDLLEVPDPCVRRHKSDSFSLGGALSAGDLMISDTHPQKRHFFHKSRPSIASPAHITWYVWICYLAFGNCCVFFFFFSFQHEISKFHWI